MSGNQWSISSGRELQLTQRRTERQREKCGNDKIKVSLEIEQIPESLITIANNMKIWQGVKKQNRVEPRHHWSKLHEEETDQYPSRGPRGDRGIWDEGTSHPFPPSH